MGGICPPIWGGTHEGGHRPYGGGDLTLIDYIINKSTVNVKLQLHNAIYRLRSY